MAFPIDPGAEAIMQNQAQTLGMGRYAPEASSNSATLEGAESSVFKRRIVHSG